MAYQFRPVVADRDAQQGMDADQTGQVSGILGERRAAMQVRAAKHPLGRAEGFLLRLTGGKETFEYLDEVGAIQRLLDREHAQGEAPQAVDVHAAGEQFGEGGDPLLSLGRAWCPQTQAFEIGLARTVLCRGDMHKGLMLQ
ncbi:hypothetical protein D3C71_1494340 [compost metagenome]